jgi:hypothetical protein
VHALVCNGHAQLVYDDANTTDVQNTLTFRERHNSPISLSGCSTPISLLTAITLTREVSGVIAASSCVHAGGMGNGK